MINQLIILQVIAYVFTSYFFQNSEQLRDKIENGFKSKFIFKHALITFILSWILSFDINFVFCAIGITITHLLIGGLQKQFKTNKYTFLVTQFLNLVVILLYIWLFKKYFNSHLVISKPISNHYLLLFLGYLICLKPTNIFIRETLVIAKIQSISNPNLELANAGKLIGILERILVLTFVIIGKLEVIGFLIAAKSILRYKDADTVKTEYVLIGTMLSFGIAMLLGLLINHF